MSRVAPGEASAQRGKGPAGAPAVPAAGHKGARQAREGRACNRRPAPSIPQSCAPPPRGGGLISPQYLPNHPSARDQRPAQSGHANLLQLRVLCGQGGSCPSPQLGDACTKDHPKSQPKPPLALLGTPSNCAQMQVRHAPTASVLTTQKIRGPQSVSLGPEGKGDGKANREHSPALCAPGTADGDGRDEATVRLTVRKVNTCG